MSRLLDWLAWAIVGIVALIGFVAFALLATVFMAVLPFGALVWWALHRIGNRPQ